MPRRRRRSSIARSLRLLGHALVVVLLSSLIIGSFDVEREDAGRVYLWTLAGWIAFRALWPVFRSALGSAIGSVFRRIWTVDEFFPRYERRAIPSEVKRAVFARDGGRCVLCGSRHNIHYDHDIPVSKGGSNTVKNIRILCQTCNLRKGAKIE